MTILYTLLAIIGVVFFENLFVALCNFRILFLISLITFKKVDWRYLCVFVAVTSIILDVIYHYTFGTNLIIIAIPYLILLATSLFVPFGKTLPSYVVKFFAFIIYYILLTIVPNFFTEGVFAQLSWGILLSILIKSVVAILVCFITDLVWDRFRGKDSGSKLRLNN